MQNRKEKFSRLAVLLTKLKSLNENSVLSVTQTHTFNLNQKQPNYGLDFTNNSSNIVTYVNLPPLYNIITSQPHAKFFKFCIYVFSHSSSY